MLKISVIFLCLLLIGACAPASYHRNEVKDESVGKLTVGTVQKEIRIGMTTGEVVEVLGSPNLVTTDEERREVWVYDKISSEAVYSESGAGLKFFTSGTAGAATTSQKTLTVIIKFDGDSKVRDFAYHSSQF